MPFAVAYPQHTVIENPRLTWTYLMLMSCMLLAVVVRFFAGSQGYAEVDAAPHLRVHLWTEGQGDEANVQRVVDENLAKAFCVTPWRFDFQWDDEGSWFYGNYSCILPCDGDVPAGSRCISSREAYLREGPAQVLFITEMKDTPTQSSGGGSNQTSAPRSHLVPLTEALGIGFMFHYRVPSPDPGIDPRSGAETTRDDFLSGGGNDVHTVLLDSRGAVRRVLPPGEPLVFGLLELCELAGDGDLLDGFNTGVTRNKLVGEGTAAHPLTRITGAELVIRLSCYNRFRPSWMGGGAVAGIPQDSSRICYLSVERDKTEWVSVEQTFVVDALGNTVHRFCHGIRVRFQPGGRFFFLDLSALFGALVDAYVLMSIPKSLVLVLMLTSLGHLSRIYRRKLFGRFDVVDQLGGMAARLTAQNAQFAQLGDKDNGMSLEHMGEKLRQTLLHRTELQEDEFEQLVNVCFQSIVASKCGQEKATGRSFVRSIVTKDVKSLHLERPIDLELFSVACSRVDPISFDDAVKLFDADRRARWLERLFTPHSINEFVFQRKRGVPRSLSEFSESVKEPKLDGSTKHTGAQQHSESCSESPRPPELVASPTGAALALDTAELAAQDEQAPPLEPEAAAPSSPQRSPEAKQADDATLAEHPPTSWLRETEDRLLSRLDSTRSQDLERILGLEQGLASLEARLATHETAVADLVEARLADFQLSVERRTAEVEHGLLAMNGHFGEGSIGSSILSQQVSLAKELATLQASTARSERRVGDLDSVMRVKLQGIERAMESYQTPRSLADFSAPSVPVLTPQPTTPNRPILRPLEEECSGILPTARGLAGPDSSRSRSRNSEGDDLQSCLSARMGHAGRYCSA